MTLVLASSSTHDYTTRLLAILATEEELGIADIWQDPNSLTYLLHGNHLSCATASDQRRAQRRAKQYQYDGKMVFRLMPSGERLRVPEPSSSGTPCCRNAQLHWTLWTTSHH